MNLLDHIAATDRPHTIAEYPPLESLIGHDDYTCLTEVVIHTCAEVARRNADTTSVVSPPEVKKRVREIIEKITELFESMKS